MLTGLPPPPDRVATFIADYEADADQAFHALVEELLASPHFGERWAQHWLDVIRWAETNGSEANLYRKNAWIYRDYVVRAFNQDIPYDQFVREQLAGQIDALGVNYMVIAFNIGDMAHEDAIRSITLFGEEVMPKLADL